MSVNKTLLNKQWDEQVDLNEFKYEKGILKKCNLDGSYDTIELKRFFDVIKFKESEPNIIWHCEKPVYTQYNRENQIHGHQVIFSENTDEDCDYKICYETHYNNGVRDADIILRSLHKLQVIGLPTKRMFPVRFIENGVLSEEYQIKPNGKKHGLHTSYSDTGAKKAETVFQNGKDIRITSFENDEVVGVWEKTAKGYICREKIDGELRIIQEGIENETISYYETAPYGIKMTHKNGITTTYYPDGEKESESGGTSCPWELKYYKSGNLHFKTATTKNPYTTIHTEYKDNPDSEIITHTIIENGFLIEKDGQKIQNIKDMGGNMPRWLSNVQIVLSQRKIK